MFSSINRQKVKVSLFKQWCESGFNCFASSPLPSCSPSSSACLASPPCFPPPQLNLIHSEVSNLAGFDVEGVINPTNAELELKDDLGELPYPPHTLWSQWGLRLEILECSTA